MQLAKRSAGDTYELVKNIPLTGHELDKDSMEGPDNGVYDPATHLFYLGDRADGLKKEGVKGSIEIGGHQERKTCRKQLRSRD